VKGSAAAVLGEADRAIDFGRKELEAGDVEVGADRACVAMLRLASACLAADGLSPSGAQAICVAYGQRFSRTGRLYSAYHRWLLDAMDLRRAANGDLPVRIDVGAATTAVERAELFRDAVARFLEHDG
jgi:uncharacterized protein (UPF0332 family)